MNSLDINESSNKILNDYNIHKSTSFGLALRKILHIVSFGAISANPLLDESIKKIVSNINFQPIGQNRNVVEQLIKLAGNENASDKSILILNHVMGALDASTVSSEDIKDKIASQDFLVINNPFDPESFALGTHSLFPVKIGDIQYKCAESAFQAQKFDDSEIQKQFEDLSGIEAHLLADKLKKEVRSDWAKEAPTIMKNTLSLRSEQNEEYKKLLVASKGSYLVANSDNDFWGDGNGEGQNILGKLLMEERKNCQGEGIAVPTLQYLHFIENSSIPVASDFKVCTYNLGSGMGDYHQLFGAKENKEGVKDFWNDSSLNRKTGEDKESDEFMKDLEETRKKLQLEVADSIFNTSSADVFCFQEVMQDNTFLLDNLGKKGFEIIRPLKKDGSPSLHSDTAIAINTKKFKDIKNQSFTEFSSNSDVAMATAIDKATGNKVTFLSGHIGGFNLEVSYEEMKIRAESSDNAIKEIIKKINKICQDSDMVVIGADFNASKEIYQDRFDPLEDDGYQIHSTGKATNLTTSPQFAKDLRERPLDHFAVKSTLENRVTILETPKDITLDPISSPSDHLPIFMKVEHIKKFNVES